MSLFEIEHYAFPDKMFEENCRNLESLGISISTKRKRNSDGLWEMSDKLRLYQVYPSDEETPPVEEMDWIEIDNPFGVVEFGTQKICKTAMTLMMNDCILRVPYKSNIKFKKPLCAFFMNIQPIDFGPFNA